MFALDLKELVQRMRLISSGKRQRWSEIKMYVLENFKNISSRTCLS